MNHATVARSVPALLAALLLTAGTAFGQDDFGDPPDGPATDPAANPAAETPAAETADAEAPDPLVARLEAARAALAAEGVVDPLPQAGPLLIAYERATLPYVRDQRAQPVRTLSGVVRVLNAGTQPVHLGPGVTLTAERQTLRPNVTPEGLRPTSDIRGDGSEWESYRTVAPGEVAEFPASFVNLPGGRNDLPDEMTLTAPYVVGGTVAPPEAEGGPAAEVEGGTEQVAKLDVAAYHRGLANLEVRRTGPKDVLAVFAVRGELTYLGRFALLDRMRAAASEGGRRGVLLWENAVRDGEGGWTPTVPPLPDAPAGPLGQPGFDPAEQARFAEFSSYRSTGWPPLQAGFAEFARAVGLLGGPDDPPTEEMLGAADELRLALREGGMALGSQGPAGDFGETLYEDATDAAAEVLASALRTLDPAAAETLIRTADPLVRPGAVRHAGPNLLPDRVPLLIELTTDESFAVRSAAASALGAFDRDDARAALAGLVRNAEDPQLAAAAAESLAVSRFPKGQTALAETLADGAEGVPSEAFAVLAEYSDPAWEGTLVALAGDETAEPDVRVAALRAVVAGRSSAADRLLADAIAGGDPVAARAAFTVLAERSDPASRALAARYALSALTDAAEAGEPLDDEVADFLRETRPPAAAEPLWTLFDAGEESPRAETIELIAALAPTAGDRASAEAVGGRLADAWERMDRAARTVTLDAVADLAPDRLPPLAGDALKSGDHSFEQAASAALNAARTDPATVDRLLIEAFQAAEESAPAIRLALTLIARATPATRAAVLEGRWDENATRQAAADAAVSRLTLYGPAQAFFYEAGKQAMRDGNKDGLVDGGAEPHRDSLRYLDIAVRLDPELAAGWSQRAFSRGQAGELEGARDDYRRALELDPYDNLAMTGLAILEIELGGDVDGGLARAEEGLKKYPEDRLFAYNMACVYGVAAKALQPKIDSGEADAETKERYERYRDKAREHLIRSYRLGLDDKDHRHHASTDPDLDVLHGDPAFEQVVAGTFPASDDDGEDGESDAPAGGPFDGPPPPNRPFEDVPLE